MFYVHGKNPKKKSIEDDNTFLDYLKSKYCSNDADEEVDFEDEMAEMPTHDLNEIAKHLRKRFDKLEKGTNTLLKQHFSFGYELSRAKNLFKSLKRKRRDRSKISWDNWILENTKISKSYANKHIAIHRLVTEYPKLKNLSMNFKELYSISSKIKTVFSRIDTEGRKWQ